MQTAPVAMNTPNPLQAVQPAYVDNATILRHMSEALHQSLDRVLSMLIAILPGILAFIVALLIFTLNLNDAFRAAAMGTDFGQV